MQKRTSKALKSKNTGEDAVSPVVGVMLLLVVTVIIAAVVATFASGLVTTQQTVPTMVADVEITSLDSYAKMGAAGQFNMKIVSVSEPIPTKDLKLVTSYTTTDRTDSKKTIFGGNTVYGKVINVNQTSNDGKSRYTYVAPAGSGSGVEGISTTSGAPKEYEWFGNYLLTEGTYMQSSGAYKYDTSNNGDKNPYSSDGAAEGHNAQWVYEQTNFIATPDYETDALDAILGKEWNHLQPGDRVEVTLIHVPTNGVLYSSTVVVK